MTQCKIGNAIVRIHGAVDYEKVEAATNKFLKKVIAIKKKRGKTICQTKSPSHTNDTLNC